MEIKVRGKRAEELRGEVVLREKKAIEKLRLSLEKVEKIYNEIRKKLYF